MDRSFTSRPPFVIGLALTILSVALLWHAEGLVVGGHGGHAHGGGSEMTVEQFQSTALAFEEAYAYEDGVKPPSPVVATAEHEHTDSAEGADEHEHGAPAIDVYLLAYQWGYRPGTLYLEQDVAYRFRMMSSDVHHGVAISTPEGSKVFRLPPEVLVEETITFDEPGEYLIYCTFYCGMLHEDMTMKIVVS